MNKIIRIDEKIHEAIKLKSKKNKIPMIKLVNDIITKYLENNKTFKANSLNSLNTPKIHQAKYDISHGTKYLSKMSNIAENMIEYFQLLKLETYPITIQEAGLDIMRKLAKFLEEQLNYKGGVIVVKAEKE